MNARQLDMFEKGAEEKDTEEKFIAWGYTLNNNFTSHIAREVERRLDCVGLFEKRHMKK